MALKHPRKITIDGNVYHWKISKNGTLHLVIIDPSVHNKKIVVNFTNQNHVITPRVVRGYIETAITRGWHEDLEFRIIESWKRINKNKH